MESRSFKSMLDKLKGEWERLRVEPCVDESNVGETIAFKWNVGWHAAEVRQCFITTSLSTTSRSTTLKTMRDHNLTCSNYRYVLGEESDLDTAPTGHWVLLKERS